MSNTDENYNSGALDFLKSTIGLMQHHDSITGTSKKHVVENNKLLLTESIEASSINVDYAIK